IPDGIYQVEVTPAQTTFQVVQPSNGLRTVSTTAGAVRSHVDFSFVSVASPWQNQNLRHDVNNDGLISPIDVLVIINEINRNGARPLTGTTLVAPPYYDVNGNREIEALDVLVVINFINANPGNGEGEFDWSVDWTLDNEMVLRKRKSIYS
ncbi:MAG: dockerin type I domain-containing protein, partial [Pirellula sp.]